MHTAIALQCAISLAAIADAGRLQKKVRKLTQLVKDNRKIAATNEVKAQAQILYLIHILEREGISPTEYDLIALSNIVNA